MSGHTKRGRPYAQMGEFDLSLIREFRCRTALYDRQCPQFRDKVYTAREWQLIANKLGYDVSLLKDRMLQLRNRYNLEKRSVEQLRRENPGKDIHSPWPLYAHLNFLSQHIRSRRSYRYLAAQQSFSTGSCSVAGMESDEQQRMDGDESYNNSNKRQSIGWRGHRYDDSSNAGEMLESSAIVEFPNDLVSVKIEEVENNQPDVDGCGSDNNEQNQLESDMGSEHHLEDTENGNADEEMPCLQGTTLPPPPLLQHSILHSDFEEPEIRNSYHQNGRKVNGNSSSNNHQQQQQTSAATKATISARRLNDLIMSPPPPPPLQRLPGTAVAVLSERQDQSVVNPMRMAKKPQQQQQQQQQHQQHQVLSLPKSPRSKRYEAFGEFIAASLFELPAEKALLLVEKFTTQVVANLRNQAINGNRTTSESTCNGGDSIDVDMSRRNINNTSLQSSVDGHGHKHKANGK